MFSWYSAEIDFHFGGEFTVEESGGILQKNTVRERISFHLRKDSYCEYFVLTAYPPGCDGEAHIREELPQAVKDLSSPNSYVARRMSFESACEYLRSADAIYEYEPFLKDLYGASDIYIEYMNCFLNNEFIGDIVERISGHPERGAYDARDEEDDNYGWIYELSGHLSQDDVKKLLVKFRKHNQNNKYGHSCALVFKFLKDKFPGIDQEIPDDIEGIIRDLNECKNRLRRTEKESSMKDEDIRRLTSMADSSSSREELAVSEMDEAVSRILSQDFLSSEEVSILSSHVPSSRRERILSRAIEITLLDGRGKKGLSTIKAIEIAKLVRDPLLKESILRMLMSANSI